MDMSPRTSLEENAGFSEVWDVLQAVLLQHRAGLKVKELREILMHTHQIDLENLRKELGFGNIISFLAQLSGYQLLHPELHGNCIITLAPKSGCTDSFYNVQRSEKQCWSKDSFPDNFLSSTSPTKVHQASPEKPTSTHVKASAPTKVDCTALQLEATVSSSTPHPGYQGGRNGILPGRNAPDATPSPDEAYSISSVETKRWSTAKDMQRPPTKTKSSDINEKILSVLTDPMFASGIRLFKLEEILNVDLGIDLEKLCCGMGYKHSLDLLCHVPNVRLMDPSKGEDCVVRFQPGSTDPFYNHQRSEKQCWSEDSSPDNFLSSTSPTKVHQASPEKPTSSHHKAPATAEVGCTALQLEATVSSSTQHPGYQRGHNGISLGRNIPDTTPSPDKANSISPVDTERWSTAKDMQRQPPKTKSSDINEKILSVLTDPMFASGIRLFKLEEILNVDLGIDLEELCCGMGYKHSLDLLCHVPDVRLMDPSRGLDCVVRFQPGCTDYLYNHQRSEKQCWSEDTFPDTFLSSTSPPEVHQASPEKPTSPHCEAPATTEVGCTALQLEATVSSSNPHPDINEKILSVLTDPMFASGIRLFKLSEILNVDLGIDLDELCSYMGYKHPLDLLRHVPNVRLVDQSKDQDCVVKFQPGIDEELLRVLTKPMFASGIRLFKLVEILNVEFGIDLENLCWRLGYKHPLDLLRNVPNVKLVDQFKGEECVVRFLPGFNGNERNLFLQKMAVPPVTNPGQQLKTELKDSPHNYKPHDFLYPVPQSSSKRQVTNSSQNGTNNISKYLPKVGPQYPQNKSKGASVTVYASKYHQKLGQPQQKVKPGSTMVFHASKTSVFVGPMNSYTTKTCATKSTFYMPYQNMDPFSNTVYPSQQHSTITSKEQRAIQFLPSNEPLVHSHGHSLSLTGHSDLPFSHAPAEEKGIDPVLQDEILVVLLQQPEGVAFGEFAGLFHRTHGYQLKICHHGFISLWALLDEMADLVTVSKDPHDPLIKCRGHHHYVFIGGGPFSSRI